MRFSEEQKKIALLVGAGCTNTEIGEELGYSADSIKKQLSRIYKKLGVKRRVEFVRWISQNPISGG